MKSEGQQGKMVSSHFYSKSQKSVYFSVIKSLKIDFLITGGNICQSHKDIPYMLFRLFIVFILFQLYDFYFLPFHIHLTFIYIFTLTYLVILKIFYRSE